MIAIRNVTKEFDVNKQKVTALSDVNFTIEKGDIFGIIGFSGAGKSTLLRMINALEVLRCENRLCNPDLSGSIRPVR